MKYTLKRVNKNKRGMSEIVAYAIMIAIAIGLAVAVFAMWKTIAEGLKPAVDCNEGTSVYLDSYSCITSPGNMVLTIKNNGRFNVSGVIVKVSDDVAKEPTTLLNPVDPPCGSLQGYCQFFPDLQPGISGDATFVLSSSVKRVSIQPFIFINNKKVVCQGTVIKEPINGC